MLPALQMMTQTKVFSVSFHPARGSHTSHADSEVVPGSQHLGHVLCVTPADSQRSKPASVCLSQERGRSAEAGQGVGAVGGILQSRGVLPEDEGRLQRQSDGEVLDEGLIGTQTQTQVTWFVLYSPPREK